jgi:membrane protease YdiL (CAAX protease family)
MSRAGVWIQTSRPLGVALVWITLYAAVSGVIAIGLTQTCALAAARSGVALPDQSSPWFLAALAPCWVIGFGVATWLVGARLAKQSWTELGWRPEGGTARALVRGCAVGAMAAALAVTLAIVPGGARLRFAHHWSAYLSVAGPVALGLLAAALAEELAFRGFPLRRLARALGPWRATGLLALLFGMVHLMNPNASVFGLVNVALAGVWLSVAFFSPGGIVLGWGLHFGWNVGLALLGAPVSGMRLGPPQAAYHPGPHAWFDGGAFGPEGGLVGTIAIAAGLAALVGSRLRRPQSWVAA